MLLAADVAAEHVAVAAADGTDKLLQQLRHLEHSTYLRNFHLFFLPPRTGSAH